jgi:RNA polymerase sigma-70 factor (ECF subfamily)
MDRQDDHLSHQSQVTGSRFLPTRWSLVLAATASNNGVQPTRALGELARIYWPPLYAFLRRRGHTEAEAEDLTQEFFARLLDKNWLASVDRAKGKFRSFLLASLNHFIANEWDKQHTKKRGGGLRLQSLDTRDAEDRYRIEAVDSMTPEALFVRRWALTVLDHVFIRLRQEYVEIEKESLFDGLKSALVGEPDASSYAQLAEQLGTTPGAVKVAAHRLRQRYRELLRDEVSQTLADGESVDEEIRDLFNCL